MTNIITLSDKFSYIRTVKGKYLNLTNKICKVRIPTKNKWIYFKLESETRTTFSGIRLRSCLFWGGLLAVSFTAVHAAYWTNMRMRASLVPVVVLAAAAGAAWLAGRTKRHKSFFDKGLAD